MNRFVFASPYRCWLLMGLCCSVLSLSTEASGQTDPLLEQQWHLKSRNEEPAGANVRNTWSTTLGAGIVVGIIDDGLQSTHPDLQPNYVSALSWDFNDNDPDPNPVTTGRCGVAADCHGTAVAGVAGAKGNNGIAVSGAAPEAFLTGLRLISAPHSDAQEAAAFSFQGDVIQVLNNSWGPADDGRTLDGPGPLAQAALETAATLGRGGRGRVILWAAGNGGKQDNCNFDGYANNRFVIAVGALADTGQQASYSEPCAAMFVTAPSSGGRRGIVTTDLDGRPGYSRTSSTDSFSGTSAATPLISGVVALMLARNPLLTVRDVEHILVHSSVRINPGDPGWSVGTPFPHNEKFGFGLIDAQAAVGLAGSWTSVPPEQALPVISREINLPIPDRNSNGLTDTITITDNLQVEHVVVGFEAAHSARGQLEVVLTSPTGVVSHLATRRRRDSHDNFSDWRFGTVRHWGENAAGPWTLQVRDRTARGTGTWNRWSLQIFGTANGS